MMKIFAARLAWLFTLSIPLIYAAADRAIEHGGA
jgi:hypothetical protein